MIKRPVLALAATLLIFAGTALAGERTVGLVVENISCAACPLIVKRSLQGVAGVKAVRVSHGTKTATVPFDDGRATVEQLLNATFERGYPSAVIVEGR